MCADDHVVLYVPRFTRPKERGMVQTIELGNVAVTRVREWEGPVAPVDVVIPDGDPRVWEDNRSWLVPDFWTPDDNAYHACLQTWVLKSDGRTILIDTGAGNGRARPNMPAFDHLHTDFLTDLAMAGVQPADVDLVINTHLHIDHVGWNTIDQDGDWIPTFPNATYLMCRADVDYWNPRSSSRPKNWMVNVNVYEDSVDPVIESGQMQAWEDGLQIDRNLRIDVAPGHTPGLGVVSLESGNDRAVFVGDLLHSPVQFLEPSWNSCFCEEPTQARLSRHRVLGWAADNNALVLPSHFGGAGAAEINRAGEKFTIKRWAAFSREAS